MVAIDFTGRRVLVTGASKGIGAACARLFAQAGALVACGYHEDQIGVQKVCLDSEGLAGEAYPYRFDVSDPEATARAVAAIASDLGPLSTVVHAAGIWPGGRVEGLAEEEWRHCLSINLDGAFHVCRSALPHLYRDGRSSLILLGSTAGQRGEAEHAHYAASKAALVAFAKSLAGEVGAAGVRVLVVAPGWVETPMTERSLADESLRASIVAATPLGRIATADQIAGPVLFAASDLASHMTGAVLSVNGGSVLADL